MVIITVSAGRKTPLAKELPATLGFPGKGADAVTVADIKQAFAAKYPKACVASGPWSCFSNCFLVQFYASRQKLTLKDDKKALQDEATLASLGLGDGAELAVKDLGPQISWTTVFVIEYVREHAASRVSCYSCAILQLGPLIVHPLIYHLPRVFYGGPVQHSTLQQ